MSPQPLATPGVQTNYVSPQGKHPLSNSAAKKPVVKFTYGRAAQPLKNDLKQSTVSKKSEVISPSKEDWK